MRDQIKKFLIDSYKMGPEPRQIDAVVDFLKKGQRAKLDALANRVRCSAVYINEEPLLLEVQRQGDLWKLNDLGGAK